MNKVCNYIKHFIRIVIITVIYLGEHKWQIINRLVIALPSTIEYLWFFVIDS